LSSGVLLGEPAQAASGPAIPEGMKDLHLPLHPNNIRTGGRFQVEAVSGDMFSISERLRELNPRLFINIIEDRAPKALRPVTYVIMEQTSRGTEEVVFKCFTLDARVIEHVRYLMSVPFEHRFAEAEKELDKYQAEEQENEMDELVEHLGLPMLRELKANGFLGAYSAGSTSRRAFGRG
jgi:hypothetical protein